MNALDYLGPNTLKRVKDTKYYMLSHFIDQLLYDGRIQNRRDVGSGKGDTFKVFEDSFVFETNAKVYIGPFPKYIDCLGRDGVYIKTQKGLREVMHVLELLAIREVT